MNVLPSQTQSITKGQRASVKLSLSLSHSLLSFNEVATRLSHFSIGLSIGWRRGCHETMPLLYVFSYQIVLFGYGHSPRRTLPVTVTVTLHLLPETLYLPQYSKVPWWQLLKFDSQLFYLTKPLHTDLTVSSASQVTTLWCCRNVIIIILIIIIIITITVITNYITIFIITHSSHFVIPWQVAYSALEVFLSALEVFLRRCAI